SLRRGKFLTHDAIVTTPAEKASLFQSTGAMVVEMENAIVRQWAQSHAIPFLGIRAIGDTADEAIDLAVVGFVDAEGRTKPASVASALLRRPALMKQLWKLRS